MKMTRREFLFQGIPFGQLVAKNREEAVVPKLTDEQIIQFITVSSTNSHLRDQSIMGLINFIYQLLELPTHQLGYYGTLYEDKPEAESGE